MNKFLLILRIIVFPFLILSIFSSKCGAPPENNNKIESKKETILEVVLLNENIAKIFEDEKNNATYVYVLENKVSSENTVAIPANSTSDFGKTANSLKDIFFVTIKDAPSGIVFSNDFSKAPSIDLLSISSSLTPQKDIANIPIVFEQLNGKKINGLSIVTSWFNRGFEGYVAEKDIALICLSTFEDITSYVFQKIKDDLKNIPIKHASYEYKKSLQKINLNGTQTATCSIATNNNDEDAFKGWTKTAKKKDIEILFLGIDFGNAKLYDFLELAPSLLRDKSPEISSKEIVTITEKFPYATKKVIVSIVEDFPKTTSDEESLEKSKQ